MQAWRGAALRRRSIKSGADANPAAGKDTT